MKEDEEEYEVEKEDEDEDEKEEEDSMLISKGPFRMITKLILAKYNVKKVVTDGPTDQRTDGQTLP